MNKALITAAGPNMERVLGYSEPTFRAFAERHDYELIVSRDFEDGVRHHDIESRIARWTKVNLLEKYIDAFDLIAWMDADIMITEFDKDIAADLDADCFQGLVMETYPTRFNPNTGVWLMRNSDESRSFLKRIREIGQLPHVWADQAAVCVALGWELEPPEKRDGFLQPFKMGSPSPFMRGTGWLPTEWNPLGIAETLPGRAKHFCGLSNEDRLIQMHKLSSRIFSNEVRVA